MAFMTFIESLLKVTDVTGLARSMTSEICTEMVMMELPPEIEEKERKPIKEGPTAFAAPASAALSEKDGPRRGIATRVTTTFKQLREVLNEWKANKIWIIVRPCDEGFSDSEICEIVRACDQQFEDGERVVTAWPPLVEKNAGTWKTMAEIWAMLGKTIKKRVGPGQCIVTANSKVETGKVFCECGVPQACLFYYRADCSVSCAKTLYEKIRRRVGAEAPIPELKPLDHLPMKALATRGGGMWRSWGTGDSRSIERPAKRRDLGADSA
ncbi:hypothetical protein ANCDUO_00588 [Ancylostoma duodenale]|uniref:Uncharacterized protein n=1 Tax=Ancylostoma duodenale TaxID=51022 RepID=A0A0C2HHF4_9BILA|nr:hypothetical protein ANCDUO_00588 [Ancylostoma duodenale]